MRVSRIQRHTLCDEDEYLVNIIQRWTYPRDRMETDCICHACWELASFQLQNENGQAHSSRQVGHHQLCINCGRSILRARKQQVMRPDASEEQQRIAAVISAWIQPRQLTSDDQACVPCWLRAQRASRRQQSSSVSGQPLQSAGVSVSPDNPTHSRQNSPLPEFPETYLENAVDEIVCINCNMQIALETAHCI